MSIPATPTFATGCQGRLATRLCPRHNVELVQEHRVGRVDVAAAVGGRHKHLTSRTGTTARPLASHLAILFEVEHRLVQTIEPNGSARMVAENLNCRARQVLDRSFFGQPVDRRRLAVNAARSPAMARPGTTPLLPRTGGADGPATSRRSVHGPPRSTDGGRGRGPRKPASGRSSGSEKHRERKNLRTRMSHDGFFRATDEARGS